MLVLVFCFVFRLPDSDRTLKVWSIEGLLDGADGPAKLSSQSAVVAHDKDINAVAIAPNDSLVCSASQVCSQLMLFNLWCREFVV